MNDIRIVQKYVVNCLNELGYNNDKISEADIRHFCRYASELSIIRGSSIASEYKDNCFSSDLGKFLKKIFVNRKQKILQGCKGELFGLYMDKGSLSSVTPPNHFKFL